MSMIGIQSIKEYRLFLSKHIEGSSANNHTSNIIFIGFYKVTLGKIESQW